MQGWLASCHGRAGGTGVLQIIVLTRPLSDHSSKLKAQISNGRKQTETDESGDGGGSKEKQEEKEVGGGGGSRSSQ